MTYTNPEDRARNDKFRAEQPAKVLAAIAEEDKKAAIRDREAAERRAQDAYKLLERCAVFISANEFQDGEADADVTPCSTCPECGTQFNHAKGCEIGRLKADIAAFLDEPKPDVAF